VVGRASSSVVFFEASAGPRDKGLWDDMLLSCAVVGPLGFDRWPLTFIPLRSPVTDRSSLPRDFGLKVDCFIPLASADWSASTDCSFISSECGATARVAEEWYQLAADRGCSCHSIHVVCKASAQQCGCSNRVSCALRMAVCVFHSNRGTEKGVVLGSRSPALNKIPPAACPCLTHDARWRGTCVWQERPCPFASTTGAFKPPGIAESVPVFLTFFPPTFPAFVPLLAFLTMSCGVSVPTLMKWWTRCPIVYGGELTEAGGHGRFEWARHVEADAHVILANVKCSV